MTRRARIWFVLAAIFALLNACFTVYAGVLGEAIHAGIHAVLTIAGLALAVRLKGRQERVATY